MSAGREYGREIYGLSLAGGLYAGGLVFGHEPTRTTGRMLFESVVLAGLANMTLKSVIGRSRPQTEEGPFRFRGFQTALERTSLPSGHSTVAFAVSSVLARRIDNPYATVGLYGMAALTAVSRIYHDNHWLSDTFLGAAIGTSVGLAVAGGGEETSVSIEPSGSGLRLSYRF
jgi:membrane-associated phospholipid phosphatase